MAGDDELREPGPGELALREKPLAPGEVVVPPKREERFGDDYDRSWPRRPSGAGDGKTLFNERIGRLEPAAGSRRGGPPAPPAAAEPTAILRPRERRPSDVPPHLAGHGSEPKGRRPSVTSPRAAHATLPPPANAAGRRPSMNEPKPTAWGRRSSVVMGDRPVPPHFGGAAAAAAAPPGRELPPHMLQQQQRRQHAEGLAPSAGRGPLSPPSQRAALPPAQTVQSPPSRASAVLASASATAPSATQAQAVEPAAAAAAPAEPAVSLEEMHAREMHAAAERAKKRREEEEQKRLEQIERAKRKAAELEEKMKAADEAKAKAKAEADKAKADAKAAAATASSPQKATAPVSAADKVSSWRAAAKPPPPPPTQRPASSSHAVPPKVLAREAAQPQPVAGQAPAKPTSILARPAQRASTATAEPSAWRQQQVPKGSTASAPVRQVPPHLAAQAAASEAAEKAAQASSQQPPARPSTPPPAAPAAAKVTSPPMSPNHKRENSQSGASKSGYKLPAVAQFDDLMSRIKGAMAPAAEGAGDEAGPAATEPERPRVKLPAAPAPAEPTTVKLPRGNSARAPVAPVVVPPAIRGRGRGRGSRVEVQPYAKSTEPPFENREPTLPFHSSRIARSQSPAPAWRQYTVRLAPQPVRRRPQARQIKNFESQKYPQPLYPFSWYPVLRDVNPRRLSRDDLLLPKRYAQNGTPIFTVRLGPRVRRSVARQKGTAPAPTVSISQKQLVRLPEDARISNAPSSSNVETGETSAQASTKAIDAVFGASALSTALGSEESSRASAWRLAAVGNSSHSALETSDSAGSLSALSRTSGTPTYSMTGELNGEKIEATPRKETAAPGLDPAALRMVC